MSRFPQKPNGKGSLKNIQVLINDFPQLLEAKIREKLTFSLEKIVWLSPKKEDDYAEYRDEQFLLKLCLDPKEIKLHTFWPPRGPQWDGLGKTSLGEVFLLEAKANIPELVTSPTGAKKGSSSFRLIMKSLTETKRYLQSRSEANWASYFYQYGNRLAHLYYLRRKRIKAYLVFLYFAGDSTVNGPKTEDEWKAALQIMKKYLGVDKAHRLSRYIADIFVNVREIKSV